MPVYESQYWVNAEIIFKVCHLDISIVVVALITMYSTVLHEYQREYISWQSTTHLRFLIAAYDAHELRAHV